MSLDGLRDAYYREKKNEIATCEQSRKRKLRELYNYTALLKAGNPPQSQDWLINEVPDESEAAFLDANDIAKHRRFTDESLPFPFQQHASLPPTVSLQTPAKTSLPSFPRALPSPIVGQHASLEEQLRAASASPSVANQRLPPVDASTPKDAVPVVDRPKTPLRVEAPVKPEAPPPPSPPKDEAPTQAPAEAQQPVRAQPAEVPEVQEEEAQTDVLPDAPPTTTEAKDVVPPPTEETVALPDVALPTTTVEEKPKAPQVVHLPPQEVQEARLEETERKLEQVAEKERKEEERLALPNANAAAELASSPSSTVGPYSQATPYAAHHSPDTSPDTETFQDSIPVQSQDEPGPDPAAQQAKEEHDRALQRQMQEARERILETSPEVPDVERQIEEEQAIRLARDGKARLGETESAPPPGPPALTEHAEEIASESKAEPVPSVEEKAPPAPAADSLPTPTTTAPEPSSVDSETTEAVAEEPQELPQPPRLGPEHPTPPAEGDVEMQDDVPPVAQEVKAPQTPSRPERMTTRVASGAIRQKSVSEIIGEKAAPKAVLTPRSSNLSVTASPTRPRSSDQKAKEVSTVIFAKPQSTRQSKALQLYSEEYASLQGASQDSSRDYLLGLFQYQAHHPPRAAPLQELLQSARKTVTTAGTLATIRECSDYKILKRVYQLQNANRWSLRQLQKSAEPARPSTHHDHLLTEMKWMHTDFKEERKWKKALAATFADWCAEYVNSSPRVQASLRIRANIPKRAQQTGTSDEDMNDAPTPDLMSSGLNETESESFGDDEEPFPGYDSKPPAGLFSLGFNGVCNDP